MPIQEFVDRNTQLFLELSRKLNCQYDVWQKGSDKEHHFLSSQKLWELCAKNGDIYKKSYEGLYCIGCEAFYTPDELDENGECFEHPGRKLEKVSEENYFFRLSKYQQQISELISSNTLSVSPITRKNEVLSFLKQPLQDISISRSNERAKNWGVPVPGDHSQRMYVWFDALNIYQTGVGFGWNEQKYRKWWPADVHVIGKGITRFHAVYWPAFLLSAGLKLPKRLFVHGYLTVDGQKMSKTVGNVVDPIKVLDQYGTDAVRYYLLREIPSYGDGDYSDRRFKELYNADLANGLGNLVSRVSKLAINIKYQISNIKYENVNNGTYKKALEEYRFNDALVYVWDKIKTADKYIDENQPWKLTGNNLSQVLEQSIKQIQEIATLLQPFLPQTAENILALFSMKSIKSQRPLFPRIS